MAAATAPLLCKPAVALGRLRIPMAHLPLLAERLRLGLVLHLALPAAAAPVFGGRQVPAPMAHGFTIAQAAAQQVRQGLAATLLLLVVFYVHLKLT